LNVGGGHLAFDISGDWKDSDLEGCNYILVELKLFREMSNSNSRMNLIMRKRICVVEVNTVKMYLFSAGKEDLQVSSIVQMPK
jgi:hypothetical protein